MDEPTGNKIPEPPDSTATQSDSGQNDFSGIPDGNPLGATVSMPQSVDFNEADARVVAVQALRDKAASAAGIMYGVMGFSVVNAALMSFSAPFGMAFGLSVTDLISAMAKEYGYVHLLWNIIPLGFYFLLTIGAKKHWGWLIFLMVCYTIDGIITFVVKDWITLAVHAYVLYLLWNGLSAAFAARKLERMPAE